MEEVAYCSVSTPSGTPMRKPRRECTRRSVLTSGIRSPEWLRNMLISRVVCPQNLKTTSPALSLHWWAYQQPARPLMAQRHVVGLDGWQSSTSIKVPRTKSLQPLASSPQLHSATPCEYYTRPRHIVRWTLSADNYAVRKSQLGRLQPYMLGSTGKVEPIRL